ncbi:copper amine oxidase N-terminal domain-containing protein [Paenibacillus koleovorans]|uniref:copper amine oxidase N-terminal domain-containing protein n=1 Tax=Paenibacillus koleovorans TaxID=121608 RepID=UPI000FD6C3F5|nr:copper amine oxidase N-terminal domain-containing protein [Paenibacillus koleovorans]
MTHTMKRSLIVLATVTSMIAPVAAYADQPPAPVQAVPISAPIAVPISAPIAVPISAPIILPISAPLPSQQVTVQVNGQAVEVAGYHADGAQEPMLPLRAVAEKLGFTLEWNPVTYSVDLSKDNVFTTVTTGQDRYTVNKMYVTLGTAPALVDSKLFVPASFVGRILHGSVETKDGSVSVSLQEQRKSVEAKGVITSIRIGERSSSVHIQGAGTDGIVLNVGPETLVESKAGAKLALSDLHPGLTVDVEHSIISTMSLPPQTAAYRITVADAALQAGMIGTAGTIEEVRTGDSGSASILIQGQGLDEQTPDEVVLTLGENTLFVAPNGAAIDKSAVVKGAEVIGFYGPRLTRSLPPIGQAWKVVVKPAQSQAQPPAAE